MADRHPEVKPAEKKKAQKAKTIYKVDCPFTSVTWPPLSTEDEATILDILCPLLAPIGIHRTTHIHPSKGTGARKRKRRPSQQLREEALHAPPQPTCQHSQAPAPPELAQSLLIGLNSITRHLESLANRTSSQATRVAMPNRNSGGSPALQPNPAHLAVIFLPQPRNSIIYEHLPFLCQLTSSVYRSLPTLRLVSLKPAAEEKLAVALGLPRVGVLALLERAPGTTPLVEFVREHVPPVHVPWLGDAKVGRYRPLRVGEVEMKANDHARHGGAVEDMVAKGEAEQGSA